MNSGETISSPSQQPVKGNIGQSTGRGMPKGLKVLLVILGVIAVILAIVLPIVLIPNRTNDKSSPAAKTSPNSSPVSSPISSPSSSPSPSPVELNECSTLRTRGTESCNKMSNRGDCESRYEYVKGVQGSDGVTHVCKWESGKCNDKGDRCKVSAAPSSYGLPKCDDESTFSGVIGGVDRCSKFDGYKSKCNKHYHYYKGVKGAAGDTNFCNYDKGKCSDSGGAACRVGAYS